MRRLVVMVGDAVHTRQEQRVRRRAEGGRMQPGMAIAD
jgi:hypothetical protein